MYLCESGCACVYSTCVYACPCVCVCERERGKSWSLGFSLGQKQTVHKEGLPLSHFNANESDSVRGLKNSLGAR